MSVQCKLIEIDEKLCEALGQLECDEDGNPIEPAPIDPDQSIMCMLDDLTDKACALRDALVCECEVTKSFTLSGFDYENGAGFYDSGSFGATVNGVATNTPWTAAITSKAQAYQAMIDQINATAGWSVTVVNDVAIPDGGSSLVDWRFNYCGDAGDAAILTIQRTTGTPDVVTLNANDGTGSFVDDNGDEISTGRQPVCL